RRVRALRRLRLQGPDRPLRGHVGQRHHPSARRRPRARRDDRPRGGPRGHDASPRRRPREGPPRSYEHLRDRSRRRHALGSRPPYRFDAGVPMKESMNFDFSDILIEVIKQKASDLHLTAGAPPMIRQKGSLVPLEGMPKLTPTDTREIIYAILNSSQRQRLETDWQIDFAYSVPGHGRFRVNSYFQRGTLGAAFRLIPSETVSLEKLGMPPVIRTFSKKPRGI